MFSALSYIPLSKAWYAASRSAFAIGIIVGLGAAVSAPTGAADAAHRATKMANPVYDWQALGRGDHHTAYENDSNMSVALAPKLGVKWMTNMLSPDVGGPTIAFNPTIGATLVYAGTNRGNMSAYSEATGQVIWSTLIGLGDGLYSTPLVSGDDTSVWTGTVFNDGIWKLDAATGALDCSIKTQLGVQGSPTEGLSSNGTAMVYASSIDATNIAGPELGIQESNCAVLFSSNPYKVPYTGAWASTAYGIDANGRRLVFVGTADPDSAEYAMDATTGALDWSFSTGLTGDYDIGAAATVSSPGINGFAHGVLYFIDKKQLAYGLDLTTGAKLWVFDFGKDSGQIGGNARSAAALDGNTLVFGMSNGVYALNATTGAKLWHYVDPAGVEVISNPAIVGPAGNEVVAFGDLAGVFHVLKLADGSELYHYQTGNYITASPSYVNGHFLIASFDGFLYDFAVGGGNGPPPRTAITSPSQGVTLPYAGSVTVTGQATDAAGVNAVQVAVQSGGAGGTWYNAKTKTFQSGALTNLVAVSKPGAKSSSWSLSVPIAVSGATLGVYANAVNIAQQADRTGVDVSFSVAQSPNAPQVKTSAVFIPPAASFSVSGSGFSAGETVTFSIAGIVLGQAKATGTGTVSDSLALPSNSLFGPASLTATGKTSNKVASTGVDIANSWLQSGNEVTHTGFEDNDEVFEHVIAPGNNNYLAMAWYFSAGAAVESSPVVYDAQVFFGDDGGTLTAVQTDSAAPVWQHTITSGAAIRSTPAIDTSTGDLTFTADDGSIDVVAVATGAAVGSSTIGGLPTSPAVLNGTAYVGSDNTVLESLSERSGKVNWSRKLAGAIHATPAFDPATNFLVTGDDSGAISAFNSATGAPVWTVKTGGPVSASPVIGGGLVYVGSSDGNVYALNETTGAQAWIYTGKTPYTTTAVYDAKAGLVYAGGTNGLLYGITAANGTLAWTTMPTNIPLSPYSGIGATIGEVFANTTSGLLVSYRSNQFGRFNSFHTTAKGLTTAPAVNDGTVYVGASDGGVYAYTTTGALPQLRVQQSLRRADAMMAAQKRQPRWQANSPLPARFAWTGQRDIGIHIDAVERHGASSATSAITYHGGPVQHSPRSYVLFWQPAGTALETRYVPALTTALRAKTNRTTLRGVFLDTAIAPARLTDSAIQTEVGRAIAINHWQTGADAQFLVLTAGGLVVSKPVFCSYHSAFALGHDRTKVVVYGVIPYSGAISACSLPGTFRLTGDPAVDAALVNLARVQNEIVNDPLLTGWHDATGRSEPTF